jgi:hypothetical protein
MACRPIQEALTYAYMKLTMNILNNECSNLNQRPITLPLILYYYLPVTADD